jgi:hypothetical protein
VSTLEEEHINTNPEEESWLSKKQKYESTGLELVIRTLPHNTNVYNVQT